MHRKITPRERVEKEIKTHQSWCSRDCKTFNPAKYRKARIDLDLSKIEVQKNKLKCHDIQ